LRKKKKYKKAENNYCITCNIVEIPNNLVLNAIVTPQPQQIYSEAYNTRSCKIESKNLQYTDLTYSENKSLDLTINFILYCNDFIALKRMSISVPSVELALSI
jgi:hypothetical protein